MTEKELSTIKQFCKETRIWTVKQIASLGMGHIGGSLSIVELLGVLYNKTMNIDPSNPDKVGRDRFVMSKGHCGPGIYTVLAQKGFFPMDQLLTLNKPHTILPSHCDMIKTPGIDMSTGSLGQGYSCAVGMAKASKIMGDNAFIYALVGDGECQEGQIWEAASTAQQLCLDNLITFIDCNRCQCDGFIDDVSNMGPLSDRWAGFGFSIQVIDGHDIIAIDNAIKAAQATKGKPSCILLNTIKGKGVPMFEAIGNCHHLPVSKEQEAQALAEIG